MTAFQLEWIKIIQSVHSPLLDTLFQSLTMMGEETFLLVVMSFIIWAVDKKRGIRMGFMLLSGMLVNTLLKILFHSPRPIGESGVRSLRVETATGDSFPSGHTQNTTLFWTGLNICFGKPWMLPVGIGFTLLVALSRVYLGVHWPIDVLGGMVIGYGWAYGVNFVMDWIERRDKRVWLLWGVLPLLVASLMVSNEVYVKATATMLGFVIGYKYEHKFIGYYCGGSWKSRFAGFAICLGILLGLKLGLKEIFPHTLVFDAVRYTILGLWVTLGAPALLKKQRGRWKF